MNVYVGPFFIVGERSFVQRTEVRRCSNISDCGRIPNGPGTFCAFCGSPLSKQDSDSPVHRAPTPDDLEGNWADVMVVSQDTKGQTVWFPNRPGYGVSYSSYKPEPLLVIDFEGIRRQTEEFLAGHRNLFDAYRRKFGVELLESFGAVHYRG